MAEQTAPDGGAAPRTRAALAALREAEAAIVAGHARTEAEKDADHPLWATTLATAYQRAQQEALAAVDAELPGVLGRLDALEAERPSLVAVVAAAQALADSCGQTSDGMPGSYEMVSCYDYDARDAVYAALDAYERSKGG